KSEAALQKPNLRVRCPVLREVAYPTTSPDLQRIRYLHPGLLGYFDLETRVLEPLENPFGPKVLPM
ncbi:MAG: hypothetical protein ACLQJF_22680, partial [Candidatus Sulfotelmatobacter sp.]